MTSSVCSIFSMSSLRGPMCLSTKLSGWWPAAVGLSTTTLELDTSTESITTAFSLANPADADLAALTVTAADETSLLLTLLLWRERGENAIRVRSERRVICESILSFKDKKQRIEWVHWQSIQPQIVKISLAAQSARNQTNSTMPASLLKRNTDKAHINQQITTYTNIGVTCYMQGRITHSIQSLSLSLSLKYINSKYQIHHP